MLGSPAGPAGPSQRGLWPLASAPTSSTTSFTTDGIGKYGVYSLFPGGPTFGSALYSHASTIGRFASGHFQSSPSGNPFYPHKVSDSFFSSSGYTFGAPTPPPGSPYSPIHITQLELLTKGFNSNIIIQQPDYPPSPKKQQEKRCEDKCCALKPQKPCGCLGSPTKAKSYSADITGCSRTNPVDWSVSVKKEPGATPCQVAEITTSASPVVKVEVGSPTQKGADVQALTSVFAPNDSSPGMAANTTGGVAGGGTLLQCTDDRNVGLGGWPMGGAHSSALSTPALWQYPAPLPMEPMVPLPVPMPPVGFQLIRDHTTGGLLLLPTATGIEHLQQAVVWPTYQQPSSHVLFPPLPPPPLQLLSSASSDYLSTSTTLHQHTQTHSTRLVAVTTDPKRAKIPMPIPATTLIKIETDATTLDQQTKIINNHHQNQNLFADQNLAPLVIYQHPSANLIVSSQTSGAEVQTPVTLTPPPEVTTEPEVEEGLGVQDAGNQTEISLEEVRVEEEDEKKGVEVGNEVHAPEAIEEVAQPDLSGLELLSNSVVELEKSRQQQSTVKVEDVTNELKTVEVREEVKDEQTNKPPKTMDDSLGGLDLLCALAEQRIIEEGEKEHVRPPKERKKHKSKRHPDEPKHKRSKHHNHKSEKDDPKPRCSCTDAYRSFKTPESEQEVRKFVASKSQQTCCKGEWPCMNSMELDMRMRLADLQRQYREKQKELSKLKPKRHASDCPKKRKRKHSTSERTSTPPPLLDKIDVVRPKRENQELLKPPTLCPVNGESASDSTPEKHSSSKKRKVGRPKKLLSSSGLHIATETIVAKKPKKGSLVGYLLAAKEKLKHQNLVYSPQKFVEETHAFAEDFCSEKSSKIRPKLKAEPTVKAYNEEDDQNNYDEPPEPTPVIPQVPEPLKLEPPSPPPLPPSPPPKDTRCILTPHHLETDKLRVLTSMGGLFYAGRLNAVEPPDVYSITLDGERGNRPHIMSREEILRDAIVEVPPSCTKELVPGTRLCAYWSQQYRCLYPGSVAEPGTPDPALDCKFVAVEFDDGDSGRIALEDIRLLPPDYPIIEYDPNPLLSLCKRRRRTSTSVSTEERRLSQTVSSPPTNAPTPQPAEMQPPKVHELAPIPETTPHKERKRLKKKKREKQKQKLHDEKRRKKHKCVEEHCKHRKHHKKHRKHKKHHHKEANGVEEENSSAGSESTESYPEYRVIMNPEDEVTMDDIVEADKDKKSKKIRDRQGSCESRSKMSAFLPARQLWGWSGKGYKRARAKGRSRKQFYKAIQRGKESITVGDSAVFLSTGRPDRPYIGRIEAMWELCGTMVVRVKWFYHPEETVGCPLNLQYPGALFESPHIDENDVQTISHKCEVLPLKEYTEKLGDDPQRYATIYDNNDIYYLSGYYDPTTTTLKMEPGIPFSKAEG